MISAAVLLIGFSLVSASIIALTHFRPDVYREQPSSRWFGLLLLLALALLQWFHFGWLYWDRPWVDTVAYRATLFTVAPAFFLFSRPLLQPDRPASVDLLSALHLLPVAGSVSLPAQLALPIAFVIGSGYLVWLARLLFGLRRERGQFSLEISLLGIVLGVAMAVSVLAFFQATLPYKLFFSLYAMAIGFAFFLVQITLALRPQLTSAVTETAQAAYANSSLTHVDCPAALARLNSLMQDKAYADSDLGLTALADRVGLSPHQLSELINRHLGKGFSRFLREWRVNAAKHVLLTEPNASVLSVGLSVGFSSQSTFYEAFREIEGMTPGQYRKLHGADAATAPS